MRRLLVTTAALALAASPCFACDWNKSASVAAPSTVAAAQPAAPTNCPTCVLPDHNSQQPRAAPLPQQPS